MGQTFINGEGDFISNASLLLTACAGGSFGGVCRRNFDDIDAALACTFLGYSKLLLLWDTFRVSNYKELKEVISI